MFEFGRCEIKKSWDYLHLPLVFHRRAVFVNKKLFRHLLVAHAVDSRAQVLSEKHVLIVTRTLPYPTLPYPALYRVLPGFGVRSTIPSLHLFSPNSSLQSRNRPVQRVRRPKQTRAKQGRRRSSPQKGRIFPRNCRNVLTALSGPRRLRSRIVVTSHTASRPFGYILSFKGK